MSLEKETSVRTRAMIGDEGADTLKNSTVCVVGLGGVGGICAESLARAGVGKLVLIDKDTVEASNVNRQIVATTKTIGQVKSEALKKRIEEIAPQCEVIALQAFYDESMNEQLASLHLDYILDCIDSLKSKKDLIRFAHAQDIPILVSTGTARKKDPSRLQIVEVEKTSYDPLAKSLRVWKRKNKIRKKIMVAFSDEKPVDVKAGAPLPSMMFVPASAGLLMASTCVQNLLAKTK
jgi:tRNA A37 threonylcarbamoyladenosine dehydratase